jgi:hypothetical protein
MSTPSEKLMAFIKAAVEKETAGSFIVGTGHAKWPPDQLLVDKAGNPAELRVDKAGNPAELHVDQLFLTVSKTNK